MLEAHTELGFFSISEAYLYVKCLLHCLKSIAQISKKNEYGIVVNTQLHQLQAISNPELALYCES